MKILVISDTHGRIDHVERVIEKLKPYGLTDIIHCGDCIEDAKMIEAAYPELTMHKVPGNCDIAGYGSGSTILDSIEGVPVMITHGHKQHAKYSYEELWIDAVAHEAKLAVFGHTHVAYEERRDGVILLNPGSMTLPKDGNLPSFAIVEIKEGKIIDVAFMQMLADNTFHRRFLAH